MTAACSCLLGYLIGSMIHASQKNMSATNCSPDRVVNRTFVYGCLSLILGVILSISVPINKPLWSVSYVFYAGGWAMLALAFLAYLLDVKGYEKPFVPFKAMGMNALMAFVFSGVIAKSSSSVSPRATTSAPMNIPPCCGPSYSSPSYSPFCGFSTRRRL